MSKDFVTNLINNDRREQLRLNQQLFENYSEDVRHYQRKLIEAEALRDAALSRLRYYEDVLREEGDLTDEEFIERCATKAGVKDGKP